MQLIRNLFLFLALPNKSSTRLSGTGNDDNTIQKFQICLSPACIADGADKTYEYMQALAPANVIVERGVCCSLCGNGPIMRQVVVDVDNNNSVKSSIQHKRVDNAKAMELFESDPPSISLIQGYDLAQQANELFRQKEYTRADELYTQVIDLAFQPAMDLQNKRDEFASLYNKNSNDNTTPLSLQWLVQARCNQAVCKLENRDTDGAMLVAQAACNLSRNKFPLAFDILARVYKERNDYAGELQALKTMLNLPQVMNSEKEKNTKRLGQLRIQRLEYLIAQQEKSKK